ncbi:MAG: nickel-binding protein [Solirubrobacteraceae bacterium]
MAPQAQWIHSFVTDDQIYCLYLAGNAGTTREHARRGGFPAGHVALVLALSDPTTRETPLAGE